MNFSSTFTLIPLVWDSMTSICFCLFLSCKFTTLMFKLHQDSPSPSILLVLLKMKPHFKHVFCLLLQFSPKCPIITPFLLCHVSVYSSCNISVWLFWQPRLSRTRSESNLIHVFGLDRNFWSFLTQHKTNVWKQIRGKLY